MALATLLLLLSAAPAAETGKSTAVDELARQLGKALAAQPVELPCSLQVDAAQPTLAVAVAAAIGPLVNPVAAESPDARTALKLKVTLENQKLVLTGTATSTWVNFWSGASAQPHRPRVLPILYAEADAVAIALAAGQAPPHPTTRVPLALRVSVLAQLPAVPAALACRDVDGDGKAEIAVLLPEGVVLLGSDGRTLGHYELKGAPLAKWVGREPFGAISLSAKPTRVAFVTARHEHGQTLELDRGQLKPVGSTDAVQLLDDLQVHAAAGLNHFGTEVKLGEKTFGLQWPLQAASASHGIRLLRYANGGVATSRGESVSRPWLNSGAAVALADFNGDGAPELLVSTRDAFPRLEVLDVFALEEIEKQVPESGGVESLAADWRATLPRGRALVAASCDLNGDGKEEALVGAWLEDGTGELSVVGGP